MIYPVFVTRRCWLSRMEMDILQKSNRSLINNYSSFIILFPHTGLWAWAVWVTQSIFFGRGSDAIFRAKRKADWMNIQGKTWELGDCPTPKRIWDLQILAKYRPKFGQKFSFNGENYMICSNFLPKWLYFARIWPPPQRKTYSKNFARFSRWVFPSTCNSGKFFKIFVICFLPQITIRRVPYAYTPIYRETGIIRCFWDPTLLSFFPLT